MERMTIKEFKDQTYIEIIESIMKANKGYITSKELSNLGIHRMYLNIMKEKGMSRGEFNNVKQAVGGTDKLINTEHKDKDLLALLQYLSDEDKEEKILENPQIIRTPVVRNGKKTTIGYCPEVWKEWE